jgi:hypothetical protein
MPLLTRNSVRHLREGEFALEPLLKPGADYLASKSIATMSSNEKPTVSRKPDWRLCGSPECRASRPLPWRSRRPVFEDAWGCSKHCLLEMVRGAVRRECGETYGPTDGVAHNHRVPLGLVLLAQGWITHAQLQSALDAQRVGGGRIGECLVLQGGIEQAQVTRGLGVQWGCPVLNTTGFDARRMATVMPKMFIEEFGVIPVRTVGERFLYLGFEASLDASLAFSLEQMTALTIENGILSAEEMSSAKSQLIKADFVPVVSEVIADVNLLDYRIAAILHRKQPARSRLVRVHQYFWLRLWLRIPIKYYIE